MADSVVDEKSNCIENDQLLCSTSSLTPVDQVLTDTSNLDDKSESLCKDESPVQQIEPMEDKSESLCKDDESPVQQIEPIEDKSELLCKDDKSSVQQIEPMEGVEHESPTPSNENKNKNDFEVGDIVWAKIGRYPFWPSIVCIDPETNVHIKGSLKNKRQFSLHVRFCNDQGRRSWAKTVEIFCGKDALFTKYPNCLALIKNSKKQMTTWDVAVKEADNWLKVNRDDRMNRFSKTNGLGRSKISGLAPAPPKPEVVYTVEELIAKKKSFDMEKTLEMQSLDMQCEPSTSGTQGKQFKAKGSSVARQSHFQLTSLENTPIVRLPELPTEPPKPKAVKRRYVDLQKKELKEALKKKKAKRALQVKKYGFSYSSSEYESTDDEAEPLVPFNPSRKVLELMKLRVTNLESEGLQKLKEQRILIKAIRLAERRPSKRRKKNKEEEEDEEQEQ